MIEFHKYKDFLNESEFIDPDLEDIRHFRGSVLQFKDYWERKMKVPFNPHGRVTYKYPEEREEDDQSLPYQDFANGEGNVVKHNLATRKRGKDSN